MMKWMGLVVATLITSNVFAAQYKLVSSQVSKGSADLWAETMTFSLKGGVMTVESQSELGSHFNFDQSGDTYENLKITHLNGDVEKKSYKTFAHGEHVSVKRKSTLKNNVLEVAIATKFGRVLYDIAEGYLKIAFNDDGMNVQIERSYKSVIPSSSNWTSSQTCQYDLVK